MHHKNVIFTENAPTAIGTYSQAIQCGDTTYISGQIPLNPTTMEMVTDSFSNQAKQVFENLKAITEAAGGSLSDIVKITVLLSDMKHFVELNEVMSTYFSEPYPARAAFAVKALPKDADVEIEAIMVK